MWRSGITRRRADTALLEMVQAASRTGSFESPWSATPQVWNFFRSEGEILARLQRQWRTALAGEIYVAIERGRPPLTHDVRAIPRRDVERVDHAALTVRLRLSEDALDDALELDPDKAVEGEGADAVRVTDLPAEMRPSDSPAARGPADRPPYLAALGLGLAAVFSLLALVLAATAVDFDWEFVLFVIPAVLFALAGLAGWRLLRRPYE